MKQKQSRARYGKARHVHHRSRSARLQARGAIHEFLEPEPDLGYIQVERSIPIRRRNDFLQGVAIGNDGLGKAGKGDDSTGGRSGPQLELTFHGEERRVEEPFVTAGAREPLREKLSIESSSAVGRSEAEQRANRNGAFTVGGFVYGCALGSAAAAAILMVVQLAVL